MTYNILFDGYGRAKRYEHVRDLVQERSSKGIAMEEMSYLVLLNLYGRARLTEEVENTVAQIFAHDNLEVTPRLLSGVAGAYSAIGDTVKVEQYVDRLLKHPNVKARDIESIYLMYSKNRATDKLDEMLKKYPPSEFAYNVCVSAFAKDNQHGKVAELLQQMEAKGMALTSNTSIVLSTLLLKAGKSELAQAVLSWKKKEMSTGPLL